MPLEGTVLLVESDDGERDRLGKALEEAGYQVMSCPGPTEPAYTCVGGREGYCPLVERADVVVLDPSLPGDGPGIGTSSEELLELYAASGRTVVAFGPDGWLGPFASGHVLHLARRPDEREVVAAVRSAPEVRGFVHRPPAR